MLGSWLNEASRGNYDSINSDGKKIALNSNKCSPLSDVNNKSCYLSVYVTEHQITINMKLKREEKKITNGKKILWKCWKERHGRWTFPMAHNFSSIRNKLQAFIVFHRLSTQPINYNEPCPIVSWTAQFRYMKWTWKSVHGIENFSIKRDNLICLKSFSWTFRSVVAAATEKDEEEMCCTGWDVKMCFY